MKERVKKLLAATVATACIVSIVGCKSTKVNAEEVLERGISELKEAKSATSEYDVNLKMKLEYQSEKVSMDMSTHMRLDEVFKSKKAHGNIETNVDYNDHTIKNDQEIYIEAEDDTFTSYIKTDGAWEVQEEINTPLQDQDALYKEMKKDKKLAYKGEGEVHKEKTYIIEATVSGEDIQTLMNSLSTDEEISLEDAFGSDFTISDLKLKIKSEFYQNSGLPARIEINMSDELNDLIKDSSSDLFPSGMKVDIKKYNLSSEFYNYNKIKEKNVSIPDEVREVAAGGMEFSDKQATGPWDSFSFNYKEKELKIPGTFADLEAAGLMFANEEDASIIVASKESEYSVVMKTASGEEFYVSFLNSSDTSKSIKECEVSIIEIGEYDATKSEFELPGGVKIGMTESELNKVYSSFSSRYIGSSSISYSYENEDYSKVVEVNIDKETGKVYSMSISYYGNY